MAIVGIIIMYYANKSKVSTFDIYDYLIDPVTKKASTTKTLQIIAGLTGTWVVTTMAVNKSLTVDFFGVYLTAMGLSEAFGKFVSARYPDTSKSADKSNE